MIIIICHLVAGGLCVDELVEDPLPELRPAPEHGGRGQRGAEVGDIRPVMILSYYIILLYYHYNSYYYFIPRRDRHPVQAVVLWVWLDHDVGVEEVGGHHVGAG